VSAAAAAAAYGIDLARALEVAVECADVAAQVMRDVPRGVVRTKAHPADVVTDIDVATEKAVRELLAEAFPDHAVVGEELGGSTDVDGGPTWWCDPVDGTTNLASGLPWTSFSLALSVGRVPLVGVVGDPWRDEVLTARADGGAHRRLPDGGVAAVRASPVTTPEGQVVLTEWASYVPWPGMLELLEGLAGQHCTSRVMGSGTLAIASVGAGRAAGAVIGDFHPEDHLAALLLSAEAGAVVRDVAGRETRWPVPGPFSVAAPGVDAALGGLLRPGPRVP
jgi:fructose-1,6-bisphosphatase/inositol monophosphatase family enzyme